MADVANGPNRTFAAVALPDCVYEYMLTYVGNSGGPSSSPRRRMPRRRAPGTGSHALLRERGEEMCEPDCGPHPALVTRSESPS